MILGASAPALRSSQNCSNRSNFEVRLLVPLQTIVKEEEPDQEYPRMPGWKTSLRESKPRKVRESGWKRPLSPRRGDLSRTTGYEARQHSPHPPSSCGGSRKHFYTPLHDWSPSHAPHENMGQATAWLQRRKACRARPQRAPSSLGWVRGPFRQWLEIPCLRSTESTVARRRNSRQLKSMAHSSMPAVFG